MLNIYENYSYVESQIKELEERKAELADQIKQTLISEDKKNEETPYGKFSLVTLKKWTYTPETVEKVKELKEEIKTLEAREQSIEEAQYEETFSLRFGPTKL